MSCPDIGTLRAYLDRELPTRRADELARHLGACESCRERLAEVEKVAGFAGSRLSRLAPSEADRPAEPALALAGIRRRSSAPRGFGVRLADSLAALTIALSPARLAAAAVSLVLVAVLLFTPVGLKAQGLLGVFRANDVVAVQIDPSTLLNLPEPEELGSMTLASKPEVKSTTLAEAGKQANLTPRALSKAPSGFANSGLVFVTTPVEGSFTYDLSKIDAYYQQRGLKSKPPAELDGLTIHGSLPPVVLQVYADQATLDQLKSATRPTPAAAKQAVSDSRMLIFAQVRSPKLEVPSGVDVAALRQKVLDSGAFPPELAIQLEAISNWQETLPVPVLKGTSRDVTVDGVHGVLVTDEKSGGTWLIWLKDGVVYGLGGTVSESAVLEAAQQLAK